MSDDDDDSQIDYFRALKKESQERRERNRNRGQAILEAKGIPFTVHNEGAHLVVMNRWDFWPGTGKWKDRRSGSYKHGINELLAMIEKIRAVVR